MMLRLPVRLGSFGILGLLAGCVNAPAPDSASRPWNPPREARTVSASWQDVRARRVDSSKPLTLAELADVALENNPASRKAWPAGESCPPSAPGR